MDKMQQHTGKFIEKQREESRKALEDHNLREERFRKEKKIKEKKKRTIISIAAVILLIFGSLITYAQLTPGKYDSFAKCLTEKGVVMYGEDWCQYTQGQKGMFGKSFKYINYIQKPNLNVRPTWIIDGKTYEKVQSFQRLSALTGCEI